VEEFAKETIPSIEQFFLTVDQKKIDSKYQNIFRNSLGLIVKTWHFLWD